MTNPPSQPAAASGALERLIAACKTLTSAKEGTYVGPLIDDVWHALTALPPDLAQTHVLVSRQDLFEAYMCIDEDKDERSERISSKLDGLIFSNDGALPESRLIPPEAQRGEA